jgi:hypothetical protein
MFFDCKELIVEKIDGVYLDVFKVGNNTYTVHPKLIEFTLNIFIDILY